MDIALKPFLRRKYLLTKSERSFYKVLRDVVAPNPVALKVRLADLIDADDRHQLWRANFDRIKAKHIDFVVCDAAFSPLIAIELDDVSHQRPDRQTRDRDVDRIFELAGMPILHQPVQREYQAKEIERRILSTLKR